MVGGDGGHENAESGKLHLALSAFLLCSPTEGLPGGDGSGKHPGLRAISTELKCDGVGLADGWRVSAPDPVISALGAHLTQTSGKLGGEGERRSISWWLPTRRAYISPHMRHEYCQMWCLIAGWGSLSERDAWYRGESHILYVLVPQRGLEQTSVVHVKC